MQNLDGSSTFWRCPHYGSAMKIVERFTVTQIQLRAPPVLYRAAA